MTNSNLSAAIAVLAGILTVLSPCVLPILPILVGRSLTSHRYGPLALVAGLIAGFATIGSLVGVTASWFAGLASLLRNGAIALLLLAGFSAIFPEWNYRLFSRLRFGSWLKEPVRVGLVGEFWLGTQLGLLWTPCAGSVLASILILAAVKHDTATAFFLLVFYGLGAGIPLLVLAYGGRYLSRYLGKLRSKSAVLQKVGGVIVVVSAIAILLGWDVQIQLWLAPLFPPLPL
ncbi:cytochrome c biogenesis CcdA family protein [Argonema antarcticum]|uniref:cytochrome c biogenesis CcdA family protein n=1 Tax=Argonema antarcticum TaxID=2942763 RepID=UPI0020137EC9|nr:cytochrome c biogenesis CcdA family protein [Argonema antarcticum]MCL1469910.1 cytochrome c biogenesis CcdA family protein [Argonema antarcticum A004/B2]